MPRTVQGVGTSAPTRDRGSHWTAAAHRSTDLVGLRSGLGMCQLLDGASARPSTVVAVAKQRSTGEEQASVIRVVLSAIADGLALGELATLIAPLHPNNATFPAEVLLGLAADAIEESGATR